MEDVVQGPGDGEGVLGPVVLPERLPLPVHFPPDPGQITCKQCMMFTKQVYDVLPSHVRIHVRLLRVAVVAVQVAA